MRRKHASTRLTALLVAPLAALHAAEPVPRQGLALWLTAEDVVVENGNVIKIKDRSGNHNDAVLERDPQIVAGNPTVVKHQAAGQPVLRFNGAFTGYEFSAITLEGISIAKRSSGCVFSDGNMRESSFDSHLGMPFDCIRTDIVLGKNNGRQGGPTGDGPRNGARVVHWNITDQSGTGKIVYEPRTLPMGALVGIRKSTLLTNDATQMPRGDLGTIIADHDQVPVPADLYQAQRALRLGQSGRGQNK